MGLLDILLISVGGIYAILEIVLTAGIASESRKRNYRKESLPDRGTNEPSVSVIVPARNEENTIGDCLASLEKVEYPEEKLEVIVVDDHSDDNTVSIVEKFIAKNGNFSIVSLSDDKGDSGKIAALACGYKKSAGEIILQTDADCTVKPKWVRTMTAYMEDNIGIIGGVTLLKNRNKTNTCFTQIQSLDWLYLLGIGAGANSIGVPLSCFGNNLSVRKKAYEDAGGYERIPFTFTEDFALFQAITRSGWDSGFSLDQTSVVNTKPPDSFRDFMNQRLRWAHGGIKLAGPGIVLLISAFLLHVCVLAALIFEVKPSIVLAAIIVTTGSDFIFLFNLARKINRVKLLLYFPLYELYYYLHTTFFGLMLPFAYSLSWKGRKYS